MRKLKSSTIVEMEKINDLVFYIKHAGYDRCGNKKLEVSVFQEINNRYYALGVYSIQKQESIIDTLKFMSRNIERIG